MFFTCCRPGEVRTLRRKQLLAPARSTGPLSFHLLHLAPQEISASARQITTKTGTIDEGLPLDTPSWIGRAFAAWCQGLKAEDMIFRLNPDRTVKLFKEAAAKVELPAVCQYQLRHGGASHDLLTGLRSEAEVWAGARWRTDSSLRRYAKTAQVQRLLGSVLPEKRSFVHSAPSVIEMVMTGRRSPPELPATAQGAVTSRGP